MLDSVELDVLLELGYGVITDQMGSEQRQEFDADLARFDQPSTSGRVVKYVRNAWGKMVAVTEGRMAEAQARNGKLGAMLSRKR